MPDRDQFGEVVVDAEARVMPTTAVGFVEELCEALGPLTAEDHPAHRGHLPSLVTAGRAEDVPRVTDTTAAGRPPPAEARAGSPRAAAGPKPGPRGTATP